MRVHGFNSKLEPHNLFADSTGTTGCFASFTSQAKAKVRAFISKVIELAEQRVPHPKIIPLCWTLEGVSGVSSTYVSKLAKLTHLVWTGAADVAVQRWSPRYESN